MDISILSDSPVVHGFDHSAHHAASAGDWVLFLGLAGATITLVALARYFRV